MATFSRFEDIEAWKDARELTRELSALSRGGLGVDRILANQIRRAAISVMANIAEGFEREGTAEFLQFLSIAKSSAAEVRSHLYVALDSGYISQEEFEHLFAVSDACGKRIHGLMKYLKSTPIRGKKYKEASDGE